MAKTIETMLEEIEGIAEAMQNGELSLEDSIKQYEKAVHLLDHCQKSLQTAEKSIKVLEQNGKHLEEVDFAEHDKEDGSETIAAYTQSPAKNTVKKGSRKSLKNSELDLF